MACSGLLLDHQKEVGMQRGEAPSQLTCTYGNALNLASVLSCMQSQL